MKLGKVLFHINDMSRGGAQRVLSVLIPYMVEQGIEVTLMTLWTADNEYELPEAVKRLDMGLIHGDKGRIGNIIMRHVWLRQIVRAEKPDVVVTFGEKACFRASVAMLGVKTPLITSVRNNPELSFAPHPVMTRLMEHKAAGCVFQTNDAMHFFAKRLQDKSVIILNPLDEKYLKIDKLKSEPDQPRRIVTAGRIVTEKNHPLLVRAFINLAQKYDDVVLQIYGSPDKQEIVDEIERLRTESGLDDRIQLKGVCNNLETELQGASVFVLSSDSEGMPNALMEAMSLGIPVVSTDCPCGGPATIIRDGKNGLLVPMNDEAAMSEAISRILDDANLAGHLCEEGKKIKDMANPKQICGQWVDYLSSRS